MKIRKNVDLKELEKYGYEEYNDHYEKLINTKHSNIHWALDEYTVVYIDKESKNIQEFDVGGDFYEINKKYIKDLIKAGLVES